MGDEPVEQAHRDRALGQPAALGGGVLGPAQGDDPVDAGVPAAEHAGFQRACSGGLGVTDGGVLL